MYKFDYKRRKSCEVNIGGVRIGGSYPVAVQSMANTSTMDTAASVAQCCEIAAAGASIVRLTAQGVREAVNIGVIRDNLRRKSVTVPLVADIHFNPKAAFAAAEVTDKVRINPGNFVDPGRTFKKLTYTDAEYAEELKRIDEVFGSFLDVCSLHGTAVRIGVNHGSLSDRIMSRYGDTPAGMVESAMEFLRVAQRRGFNDIVISIKASNVVVMVDTVRLLVATMAAEDMAFPLHLGVTEAGDGEDGRVKSAVGIGCLLSEGIGDTIRVSLSENPANEVPVANELIEYIALRSAEHGLDEMFGKLPDVSFKSDAVCGVGGDNPTVIVHPMELLLDNYIEVGSPEALLDAAFVDEIRKAPKKVVVLRPGNHVNVRGAVMAMAVKLRAEKINNPLIPRLTYCGNDGDKIAIHAAADFGSLLLGGITDGMWLDAPDMPRQWSMNLALSILQAARIRFSKTEFIACPGCGRTMFNLEQTLAAVKLAVGHLKDLKIGVMGCVVNGPGEMADADFGYVGAGVGRISLYKGRDCVEKNIPQEEAIPRLIALIKKSGRWHDPLR